MKRIVSVLGAVVLLAVGLGTVAEAQSTTPVTAGGYFGQGGLAGGVAGGGGQPTGPTEPTTPVQHGNNNVIPVSTGSAPQQTTRWVRHYWGGNPFEDPGYATNAPILCSGGARPYEDTLMVIATGEITSRVTGCEAPGSATPGGPGSPPPPPPTPDEVWRIVPLATPVFGISPEVDGLTGMATYLWDPRGNGPVSTTATIRGYTTTATAVPSRWEWRMGGGGRNPNPVLVSGRPGTRERPAATYTYETKGDYTLTLTVTWSGTYTFTGPGGGPAQTVDLGTTSRTSTRTYHVPELRPVLAATGP